MADTAIWAAALFIPLMTLVVCLAPSFRRAIESVTAAHTVTTAERDAGVQASLADVAGRRHRLAISQALVAEETTAERARLAAETAQYETDREAAGKVIAEAVEARRKVIAARAEAEAELAPEAARATLRSGEDVTALGKAYAVYCSQRPAGDRLMGFGEWAGSYAGLGG